MQRVWRALHWLRVRLPFRERAGLISKGPVWVWFVAGRMFTGDTLCGLLLDAIPKLLSGDETDLVG